MNLGVASVERKRVVLFFMILILVGGDLVLSKYRAARGSRVHNQGGAHNHALPRGQREGGRQRDHQSDRKRLPAARSAQAS